jgi:SpoVK/Ycf46/Vps4 family AAA+-type ATPase
MYIQLLARCRRREVLWEGLGATLSGARNAGVRALFSGDSGTGKTLAAAHLATELGAPLYRLDLAAVMNKYIGETEKNLGLLLDEAAANDVILLMDEADALFGQRSDGDGNGERFANMLTNFLLTRIEAHPGIVLLTSNSRNRIDPAFTRRLDAVLEFPLPGFDERLAIWRSHLGSRSPGDDLAGLLASYCELPGGFVRNAVLNAAAREPGGTDRPLSATGLVAALREEYRKLGRAMPANLAQVES